MTAPPASIALLSALLAPLSLGPFFEKGFSEARHIFAAFRDYALQRFRSCAYTCVKSASRIYGIFLGKNQKCLEKMIRFSLKKRLHALSLK